MDIFYVSNLILIFYQVVKLLLLTLLVMQAESFNFSYPMFNSSVWTDFVLEDAVISNNAIQVTPDSASLLYSISNYRSGLVSYKQPFKLWDSKRGMKASFNSTFVISIFPVTSPGREGLAFILSRDSSSPNNSAGQWLGIMNASTVGLPSNIVAVEFDTRKSYQDDIDDNHVGVDVNSIYSMKQEPLGPHGVNLSSGVFIYSSVQYDAIRGRMSISVSPRENMKNEVLQLDIDLSESLPEDVFLGFSGSTWERTQLNSILSWEFTSLETIASKDSVRPGMRKKDSTKFHWIWILMVVALVTLLSGVSGILYWKRKQKMNGMQHDAEMELKIQSSSTAPKKFRLRELKSATGNFNSMYKLGKGGFGTVYKGIISSQEVAVKRISNSSHHGKQDFIAEITTIGNLHHKNLVKLIGWCYESNELLLVYEFMPHGSLDKLIFCSEMIPGVEDSALSWEKRHHIICGVARALDYLHYGCEKRVLHRDIKASNIMLDSEFSARLGDFGLARTIHLSDNTHYSTKVIAGTPGYMAPESFHTSRATVETDVYAFGVLILEVVTGRKPGHQSEVNKYNNNIVDWVWEHNKMDRIIDVIDVRLNGNFDKEQTECVLILGLACCHPNPFQRPSMRDALQVLTGEANPPVIPTEKPAFMWPAVAIVNREESDDISGGLLTPTTEFSGR